MPPRKGPPPEQLGLFERPPEKARDDPRMPDYRPLWEPRPPTYGANGPSMPPPAPTGVDFDGMTYDPLKDYARLSTQLRDVWDRLTADPERWWTLRGLTEAINLDTGRHHTEAAVSARIRDLRKPKFGRYEVQRRPAGDGLFFYRLDPIHYRTRVQEASR